MRLFFATATSITRRILRVDLPEIGRRKTERQALDPILGAHQMPPKWRFHTHLLPRDYDIFESKTGVNRRTGFSEDRSASRSASRSIEEKARHLKTKEQPMEHGQKLYAAKTVPWPGATPFPPPVCGPNPLRASGVTPGHDARAQLARSVFCRVREFKIVIATLQGSSCQYEQSGTTNSLGHAHDAVGA